MVVVGYTVKLYKASTYTDAASIDLTEDVLSIPIFTDTGDGEMNTATLRLNGRDGKYLTGPTSNDIIRDHDRIKIYVNDTAGNIYQKCFEVMSKVPIKNKIEPQTVQLELAGIEIAFQRVRVTMNTFDLSTQDMYVKLMEAYEQNRTAEMPAATYTKENIPDIMSNLDWSSEDTILNRLNELVDSFGASGENNGVLNYFDMRFTTSTSDTSAPTTIAIVIGSSGLLDQGSYESITDTIEILGKVEPALVSQIGAWGAGDKGSLPVEYSKFAGRQLIMPENKGSASNFPPWESGKTYPVNSRVSITTTNVAYDKIYRKINNNAGTSQVPRLNTTDWIEVTTSSYYGGSGSSATATATVSGGVVTGVSVTNGGSNYSSNPIVSFSGVGNGVSATAAVSSGAISSITVASGDGGTGYTTAPTVTITDGIQYSPWTGGSSGAKHWKNNGAAFQTDNSGPFYKSDVTGNVQGLCMFDGNLIINDNEESKGMFRTWVDIAKPTDIFSGHEYNLLYGANNTHGKYKGLRVLVTGGTVGGAFVGYDNHIMEYDGTGWISKYEPEQTGMRVAVLNTAQVYAYNSSGSGSWADITTLGDNENKNGLDCFHPYKSLENTTSSLLDPDIAKSIAKASRQYTGVNNNSAIKVTYQWYTSSQMRKSLITDVLSESISSNAGLKNNFYESGAWLSFRFPFPVNTYNSSTTVVGALYGGSYTADGSTSKVPYLDLANNTYTHDGKLGFNEESSEDLGEISSVDFNMKLTFTGSGGNPRNINASGPFNKGNFPMRCFLMDDNDHVIVQDFVIAFTDTWQSFTLDIGGFTLYKGRKPLKAIAWSNVVPLKELEYIDTFDQRNVRMMCICTKDSYDSYDRYAPQTNMFGNDVSTPSRIKTLELYIDALRFKKPLLAITPVVDSSTETLKQTDFLQRPNIIVHDQLEGDAQAELNKQSFPYEEYNITTKAKFLSGFGEYFYLTDNIINHTDGINGAGDMDNNGSANTVALVAKHVEYSITKPIKNLGGLVRKIRGIRRFLA